MIDTLKEFGKAFLGIYIVWIPFVLDIMTLFYFRLTFRFMDWYYLDYPFFGERY